MTFPVENISEISRNRQEIEAVLDNTGTQCYIPSTKRRHNREITSYNFVVGHYQCKS
jgi:hypothetical protein